MSARTAQRLNHERETLVLREEDLHCDLLLERPAIHAWRDDDCARIHPTAHAATRWANDSVN
jgi:hypothetical protein